MRPPTGRRLSTPACRRLVSLLLAFSLTLTFFVLPERLTPLIPTAEAAAGDLFISEYIEGSSFNKALEIYNGTGASVDLAAGQYRLELYSNGAAAPSQFVGLMGTIAAGDVFVIAHGSANAAILAQADVTNSSVINHNGDDAFVLRKGGAGGPVVDVIGQVGFDPGTEWGSGLTSTADNTIRRQPTVCAGDTNPSDAFNPATEWDGFANDTFDGLGTHTAFCDGPTPTPTPTPSPTPTPTPTPTPSPTPTPTPADHVVISQIYGGGGNSGAPFSHDYVELYNPSAATVTLNGWSVQYSAATNTAWTGFQALHGRIEPGQYYLIRLATNNSTVGSPLPPANSEGDINMSGTTGKVALVNTASALPNGCPVGSAAVVDFVGYGSNANCREGGATTAFNAPAPSNTTAIFRKGDGAFDTDHNANDFITGAPNPRRTAPIIDQAPMVSAVDTDTEIAEDAPTPRDASFNVFFSESVEVTGTWYDINCTSTGPHTAVVYNGPRNWIVTPDANFQPGEQCTFQVFASQVRDTDLDDAEPNTDQMQANFSRTFTVATGNAAPETPDVHLLFGNPSDAVADLGQPNNYLMEKPEFALSYNRDRGTPNWVSWHLSDDWTGFLPRQDTFRPDPAIPVEWNRVLNTDYSGSGFDRGHVVASADRAEVGSVPLNQATFLMTNMIPQAPANNQQTWNFMEQALRNEVEDHGNELYIVAGGAGIGGSGANGFAETIAGGKVTVPAFTWKVALVLPKMGGNDLGRVGCGTRTIAVIVPNTQSANPDWTQYLTTVDAVEQLTGYNFFENLPDAVENCVEAGVNGVNPPGAADQSVTTEEDVPVAIMLDAASPGGGPLTYTIVSGPSHGTLSGDGAGRTYTPAANFHGADSFTFKVNDGANDSNTATVHINVTPVNDAPTLAPIGDKVVLLGDTLTFTASGSDVDGGDEMLTYVLIGTPPAGAAIDPVTGVFTWTPTAAQAGQTHTFGVRVSDAFGLSDEETISVGVGYEWSGVLQPINADGSSIFKLGRVVPIRFQLTGASAGVTDALIQLYVAKVTDNIVGDEEEAESNSDATEGNLFRYADGQYVYNLDTRGLTPGTYQLRIDMGDGVSRTVNISLR